MRGRPNKSAVPGEYHPHTGKTGATGGADEEEPYTEKMAGDLLEAFELLARRGSGALAWATPFRDDPIAFLLDSISDATSVWDANGDLLFRNRAAEELGIGVGSESLGETLILGGRQYERRCIRCQHHGVHYLLEVVHEIQPRPAPHS